MGGCLRGARRRSLRRDGDRSLRGERRRFVGEAGEHLANLALDARVAAIRAHLRRGRRERAFTCRAAITPDGDPRTYGRHLAVVRGAV
jgi:hypothetical protein